ERLLARGGSNEQRQRLNQLVKDLDMATQVEEIGLSTALMGHDTNRFRLARREYASAFSDYGIDLANLEPAAAADRIRASAICEPLLGALDEWGWICDLSEFGIVAATLLLPGLPPATRANEAQKLKELSPRADPVPPERLQTVVRLADQHELRNRIRALGK